MKGLFVSSLPATAPRVARRALLGGLVAAPLLIAGCAPSSTESAGTADGTLLRDLGFEGAEAREIIDQLEALPLEQRPAGDLAAVRPFELVLSDESGREARLPLPEDEFYLSLAPFLTTTHDCHFHSLTTCIGELRSQDLEVQVTDDRGAAVLEETVTTNPNGFLGLWLPRESELTLTCAQQGMSGSASISTSGEEAATCLTTLRMTA